MGKIFDLIDGLFNVQEPHSPFFRRRVPETIGYSYCFGGMAFTYFLILAFTGLLLSVYYVPSEKEAFGSVVHITDEVTLGWLVRSLHKWSASLFIIFILLHSIRVFVSGAYRKPRELNWMAGVLGFVLVMLSGFTGYLLPWDQRAYWATEVGTAMITTVPFVGEHILHIVRGGAEVNGFTLVRFYSLHVLYLPASLSMVLWAHFHMVKRLGIAEKL
jgi:quinol-cytochrome oxidoreductase complex cytochrome b subunit